LEWGNLTFCYDRQRLADGGYLKPSAKTIPTKIQLLAIVVEFTNYQKRFLPVRFTLFPFVFIILALAD